MANVTSGNVIYVDSTGDLTTDTNKRIAYVSLTATGANGRIVIREVGNSNPIKLDLRVVTSGATQVFDFSRKPVIFATGINVGTLSNAVCSIIVTGPSNSGN